MSFLCVVACVSSLCAAVDDPVVMKINGKDVPRSEFEYNYNKNNSAGVLDKKSVEEYAVLFVNYKLKVEAALDEGLDTVQSFLDEFRSYRDQQVLPLFVSADDEEAEVRRYYDSMVQAIGDDGLIHPSHILVSARANESEEKRARAKERIDSIYAALQGDADFAALAAECSDDKNSGPRGGNLGGWFAKGQTMKEFEDAAFALAQGEMSEPFLTPLGYHIVLMKERKSLEPYDEIHDQVCDFLLNRGMRARLAGAVIDSLVAASGGELDREAVIERKIEEVGVEDPELKYLVQEYHDGLLLFEVSKTRVWDKAAKDTVGLTSQFESNRDKYDWEGSRFKGVVYHCKEKDLVKKVRKVLSRTSEDEWVSVLRGTFNKDSLRQIRAEKNLYKLGDNAFADSLAFKQKGVGAKVLKLYPYPAVYGRLIDAPEEWTDVKGEVVADYQAVCEEAFVADLRARYSVEVYESVLKSVNKH